MRYYGPGDEGMLIKRLRWIAFLALFPAAVLAQGSPPASPWLPEPGTASVGFHFGRHAATEYYYADQSRPTPGNGAELTRTTGWLQIGYAVSDAVAVTLWSGRAASSLPGAAALTAEERFSGLIDSNLSVTWKVADEAVTGTPTVALRAGVIAAGPYPPGHINALGDGGHGVEAAALVGQRVGRLGFAAEAGYRYRSRDIPADVFVNLSGYFMAGDRVTLAADYRIVNARDAIDLSGPEFDRTRFPELEEDLHFVGGRVLVQLGGAVELNGYYGQIVDGRNTPASGGFGGGVTYFFR